jgi:uridine phosphorylase
MIALPEEDYSEQPIVSPRQAITATVKSGGLKAGDSNVPKHILLSLTVGATATIVRQLNAKEVPWIYRARPFYVGHAHGIPVGCIWAAPGAPLTTMVMEDLIASGAKVFVGVGLMAAIQPRIKAGDLIIPSVAVRDEGTSHHYLPKNVEALPNKDVFAGLTNWCKRLRIGHRAGPIWTTDAPYRETPSKVKYFHAKGILGVDLETSVIFSVAIYRRVRAGCILVASSNLAYSKPAIGFYSSSLKGSVGKVLEFPLKPSPN